jgi:glycosyltransferase involved in cell wall biosynthesis
VRRRVLIVIPTYSEEKTIASVLKGLRRNAPECDLVVVNDNSKDATGNIVAQLGENQLRLQCNLGYGKALQTGLKYALLRGYDIVVSFDADGQHQPEDVPRLVQTLHETGADMVIGSRFCNGRPYKGTFARSLGQILFSHLTRLMIGQRIYDTTSGFKASNSAACERIVNGVSMDFHTETIIRLSMFGFKIEEVPIDAEERMYGRSMHSSINSLHYPLKTILLTLVAAIDGLLGRRAR